ncbi:MAG: hypothetical protein WA771_12705 [Chthoniobacterales bacterium]
MTSSRGETLAVFGPVVGSFVVAAACLAGLVWDGSGYLFNAIQDGEPLISHHRYSNLPVLWAVVSASHLTGEPLTLVVLYGLLLAVVPVGALGLSFYFLRGTLVPLRVWPVLGILVVALPGQICVMSEATLVMQAFWPVLAILASGLSVGGMGWLAVLIPYLFFLHPLSAPLFALGAVLAAGQALVGGHRWRGVAWSVVFSLSCFARVGFSVATATSYERGEFAWQPNYDAMLGAIYGWPSLMITMLFVMAWAAVAGELGWLPRRRSEGWFKGATIGFGLAGVIWAAQPELWAGALGYRRFVMLLSLPLIGGGLVQFRGIVRDKLVRDDRKDRFRYRLVWPAVAFGVVLTVQSFAWRADVARFAHELRAAHGPVVTMAQVPWITRTPLDHWGSSFVALFVQGQTPSTLFALENASVEAGRIRLYGSDCVAVRDGWFHLSGVLPSAVPTPSDTLEGISSE